MTSCIEVTSGSRYGPVAAQKRQRVGAKASHQRSGGRNVAHLPIAYWQGLLCSTTVMYCELHDERARCVVFAIITVSNNSCLSVDTHHHQQPQTRKAGGSSFALPGALRIPPDVSTAGSSNCARCTMCCASGSATEDAQETPTVLRCAPHLSCVSNSRGTETSNTTNISFSPNTTPPPRCVTNRACQMDYSQCDGQTTSRLHW